MGTRHTNAKLGITCKVITRLNTPALDIAIEETRAAKQLSLWDANGKWTMITYSITDYQEMRQQQFLPPCELDSL